MCLFSKNYILSKLHRILYGDKQSFVGRHGGVYACSLHLYLKRNTKLRRSPVVACPSLSRTWCQHYHACTQLTGDCQHSHAEVITGAAAAMTRW